jgi:hypothetical protein
VIAAAKRGARALGIEYNPDMIELSRRNAVKAGIVSNTFAMGTWVADRIITVEEDCQGYCIAYLWIVPARVEGRWQLPRGEIHMRQSFQMINGTIKSDAGSLEIRDGRLEGNSHYL